MPSINLLPWREERRKEQQQEFFILLGAVVLVSALLVSLAWAFMNVSIDNQRERNAFIQQHIADLELQVKEIKDLKQRRADMLERMRIIQDLQGNRALITRVFNELVLTLPDGVFFNDISLVNRRLSINGTAESNNRVSSLMRKLASSEWFKNPNLSQVKANPDEGEQASDFTMSVTLVVPGEAVEEVASKTKKKARSNRRKKQRHG